MLRLGNRLGELYPVVIAAVTFLIVRYKGELSIDKWLGFSALGATLLFPIAREVDSGPAMLALAIPSVVGGFLLFDTPSCLVNCASQIERFALSIVIILVGFFASLKALEMAFGAFVYALCLLAVLHDRQQSRFIFTAALVMNVVLFTHDANKGDGVGTAAYAASLFALSVYGLRNGKEDTG